MKMNEIICCLCDDIVQTPVRCRNCLALYCNDCADKLKHKRKKCVKENIHNLVAYVNDTKLEESIRVKLNFLCKCGKFSSRDISEVSFHLIDCNLMIKSCPNEDCNFKGEEKEMEVHIKECKFFSIRCGICGYKITSYNEQMNHNCMVKIVEGLVYMQDRLNSEKDLLNNYIRQKKIELFTLAEFHGITMTFCPVCRSDLIWIGKKIYFEGFENLKCVGINNCNNNIRFKCQNCKSGICTNCVKIYPFNRCFCGNRMVITLLKNHRCDLCRKTIEEAYSCNECDFDICLDNCYNTIMNKK
jgi:hypothetical protein